ncbi:MAG: polysaccharide pyruvyl transferase family protein [Candidatus Methanosuratincola sp.]
MPRIIILHGVNYWNAGDLGIIRSMVLRLREEIPSTTIHIHSIFGDIERAREITDWDESIREIPYIVTYPFKNGVEALVGSISLLSTLVYGILYHFLKIKARFLLTSRQAAIIDDLMESDVVLSKGGNFFLDKGRGLPGFTLHLHQILLSILLRKPTVIYAQSIGPFKRKWTYTVLKAVLRKVDLVLLREPCSFDFLKGLKGPVVKITADEAFLLPAVSGERARELLKMNGIEGNRIVGITVLDWSYPFSPDPIERRQKYIASLASVADWLIKERAAEVFFVPHLVGFWGTNDLEIVEQIIQHMRCQQQVRILGTYTAEEIKGILGQADIVIGTRMHSNIFALAAGTPCLVISYLPKCVGIMRMLGLEEWVIPIEDITPEVLCDRTKDLLEKAPVIRAHLRDVVPEMKEKARENARLVRILVEMSQQRSAA